MQDYHNIETFSAPYRKTLGVKRFLLKKQNESTDHFPKFIEVFSVK